MRLTIYSHDSYGLGNIRRMLEICKHLLKTIPKSSILLISGSPLLHNFRLPEGLDYIKLPCIRRDRKGQLSAKFLTTDVEETIQLRAELIKTTMIGFKPDLLLVDKKPYGLKGELKSALDYLQQFSPQTKVVLLLRDILDRPEKTISEWIKNQFYGGIKKYYDRVLVVGMREIFDLTKEYKFPNCIAQKVKFCGYIRRESGNKTPAILRQELGIEADEKLVLVTTGGGDDGYNLVHNYLLGLTQLDCDLKIKSLIISGPEMPLHQQQEISQKSANNPQIQVIEFTDDLNSYIEAADVVVSMGGYNTTCEILSLKKKSVIVPRFRPVQEQWIRTERMAHMNLFKSIHPDRLRPENLIQAVMEQLNDTRCDRLSNIEDIVDLDALPKIAYQIYELLNSDSQTVRKERLKNRVKLFTEKKIPIDRSTYPELVSSF
ncbi:MAG: glycosyltransferase [Prochloraceae cyanobacterium]|nr:glycosyltransferase [Prochloraceae cyanobacterium]